MRTLVEEYEDEAAERKATYLKHGSKVYPSRTFLALVTGKVCLLMELMSSGHISKTVPFLEVITNTC